MELNNIVVINNLLDAYGKLLTKKQQQIMDYYYKSNYSLSEIAESLGITRQAVNFSLKQSLESLNNYEEKLHLVEIKNIVLKSENSELKNKVLSKMEE